ncbi:hypothetical protein [Achromobacter sp. UMC46]|uniref:hypothetical protein n=1 Tax=Achromobacter sp. UMC46 TaxID=1862319 RepID=UPI001C803FAF|nr:hypothetical protein [Achromobacter sp. UMC46]
MIISDSLANYGAFHRHLQQYPDSALWVLDASDLRFFELDSYAKQPELVLLDVTVSKTKCLAATARVRAMFPDAKIAVRVLGEWDDFGRLILQSGAHGVIDALTYRSKNDLAIMIDSIMAGNIIYRESWHG